MTDFLLATADDGGRDEPDIECKAWDEEGLKTCPCASCRSYRLRKEADQVYEDHYQAEMERINRLADDPYYQSQEYLNSKVPLRESQ